MTRHTVGGTGDRTAGGRDSSHETIHHDDQPASRHGEEAVATKAKVCIVCGENVAGRRRYKDGAGRYYCETCFNAQSTDNDDGDDSDSGISQTFIRKTPAPAPPPKTTVACPDCKQEFEPQALVDVNGTRLCEACAHHRELSARREAARIAAAEEEALRQQERRKMVMITAVIVVAILALYGVLRLVVG